MMAAGRPEVPVPYRRPMASPAVRAAVDKIVMTLARLVSKVWFRRVETQNLDRISTDRPVLVCANHANGFVDPVSVLATSPRPLHFIAKASLWKLPPVGAALSLVGALPVKRRPDGEGSNKGTFDACHEALRQDRAIAIFPEGAVNDTATLKPIKTGAARIALGARASGALGLRIVCVGLVYEQKARPRGRVLVRAAAPIDLDKVIPTLVPEGADETDANHELVDALTGLIEARLKEASLDYHDVERMRVLAEAAAVYERDPEANPVLGVSLAGVEPLVRRLDRAPETARGAVVQAMSEYQAELDVLGLRDVDVVPGNTPERLQQRLATSTAKVAALAVPAAVGVAVNAVPYQAVKQVWRRPVARISKANNTLLAGLVAFPVAWTAWALAGRRAGVKRPFVVAYLAGPLTGHAAVACWEQLEKFRTSRTQWQKRVNADDLLGELMAKRQQVVDAIDAAAGEEVA